MTNQGSCAAFFSRAKSLIVATKQGLVKISSSSWTQNVPRHWAYIIKKAQSRFCLDLHCTRSDGSPKCKNRNMQLIIFNYISYFLCIQCKKRLQSFVKKEGRENFRGQLSRVSFQGGQVVKKKEKKIVIVVCELPIGVLTFDRFLTHFLFTFCF